MPRKRREYDSLARIEVKTLTKEERKKMPWATHYVHCPHCGSNLLMKEESKMERPVIVVEIVGGMVQNVYANQRLDVWIVDRDTEGADDDRLRMIDGEQASVELEMAVIGEKADAIIRTLED
jgi:DNA-directed RNA polymerase subunit RPC12/RpoP